jgi:hypothetical protein
MIVNSEKKTLSIWCSRCYYSDLFSSNSFFFVRTLKRCCRAKFLFLLKRLRNQMKKWHFFAGRYGIFSAFPLFSITSRHLRLNPLGFMIKTWSVLCLCARATWWCTAQPILSGRVERENYTVHGSYCVRWGDRGKVIIYWEAVSALHSTLDSGSGRKFCFSNRARESEPCRLLHLDIPETIAVAIPPCPTEDRCPTSFNPSSSHGGTTSSLP